MGWETIIPAAGSIVGGMMSKDAAENAAASQAASASQATGAQLQMFNRARADQTPWRIAGAAGLNKLNVLLGLNPAASGNPFYNSLLRPFSRGDFQADPGYQFRLGEGEKGINRAAAARGLFNSGGTLKALNRFNQDYATGEFTNAFNRFNVNQGNQFNRLASISGVGQTAANQIGNQGIQTGNMIGNNMMAAGNARASGYVGGANAINNSISQGIGIYNQNRMLDILRGGGGGGTSGSRPYQSDYYDYLSMPTWS